MLPAAAVFGANASGKSSLLRTMYDMRQLVLFSFRWGWPDGRVPPWPFRLAGEDTKADSLYEVGVAFGRDHGAKGRAAREVMREADLGISGAHMQQQLWPAPHERLRQAVGEFEGERNEHEAKQVEIEFKDFELRMKHRAGDREVELLPGEESRGTLIWFGMIGPVLQVLREGSVLLADELDASLHPALVGALVRLFQSSRSNPHRAQLIFDTHDVTLLGDSSSHPLGRDQIWFTEKDNS